MSEIVAAHHLARFYKDVVGLNDLTVEIEGGITGILGPNGAGKSTFLKLLVGELRPSRGTVRVLGLDPFANRELYRRIGFCPQQDAFWGHLSGREFVQTLLRLSGFGRGEARQRAVRALERVGLEGAMERRIDGYSKGMRQRTKLAQALAHGPQLLVADEPLTGLDPVARKEVQGLFVELAAGGMHLLVSSHVLHEVEALTSHVVVIHRGRLLARGEVGEVRRLLSRHPRQVRVRARDPRRLAEACVALEHVGAVRLGPGSLSIETSDVESFFRELPPLASRARAGISGLESTDANLEAVFDYLLG